MTRLLVPALLVLAACGASPSSSGEDGGIDGVAPVEPGVHEIDLGAVVSDTPYTFVVPEHALGFQLVVEVDNSNGTEQVGISTLRSPSGAIVIDNFFPVSCRTASATRFGIAAASVPQSGTTLTGPVEAGTWLVDFSIPSGAPTHARAFVRTTADGQFHGGALDVRVYIPDGLAVAEPTPHTITAATAAADPGIAMRLDSFFATVDQLYGFDRGVVEFVPLPATMIDIKTNDQWNQVVAMTSSPGPDPVVHLILLNELTRFDTTVWGSSAGGPGTATKAGHKISGVGVDISFTFGPAADGQTLAHEVGHFLGLYHTTELDRSFHDPLGDTPECTAAMAVCPDRNNIMYVTFYGETGGVGLTSSAQQRRVVQASPLYRATP